MAGTLISPQRNRKRTGVINPSVVQFSLYFTYLLFGSDLLVGSRRRSCVFGVFFLRMDSKATATVVERFEERLLATASKACHNRITLRTSLITLFGEEFHTGQRSLLNFSRLSMSQRQLQRFVFHSMNTPLSAAEAATLIHFYNHSVPRYQSKQQGRRKQDQMLSVRPADIVKHICTNVVDPLRIRDQRADIRHHRRLAYADKICHRSGHAQDRTDEVKMKLGIWTRAQGSRLQELVRSRRVNTHFARKLQEKAEHLEHDEGRDTWAATGATTF